MRPSVVCALCVLALALPVRASAKIPVRATAKREALPGHEFPIGTPLSNLGADNTQEILRLLGEPAANKSKNLMEMSDGVRLNWVVDENWSQIPRLYFGDAAYNRRLADLIVYLNSSNEAYAALVVNGDVRKRPTLFGNKRVWVLLFTDRNLNKGTTDAGDSVGYAFGANFEPLTYASDYGEKTIRGVLHAAISDLSNLAGEETKEDSAAKSDSILLFLRGKGKEASLYAGAIGFDVQTNSINRIVLHPTHHDLTIRSIHMSFAEYSGARIGGGLGIGYTFRSTKQPSEGDRVSGYVLGHYYFHRAELPTHSWCWGPIFGTSVGSGGVQKNLMLGIRGRAPFLGQTGLWTGVNLLSGVVFREGVTVGLDYRL